MDLTADMARKWRISSPKVASSESRPAVEAEGSTHERTRLACAGSGSGSSAKTPTKILLAGINPPPPFH